ncbi:hypothetical protein B484DRAFT_449870 [Ochromonadaceae sp. CCMP2298]|nr:hypothetical protein B484DRAFT_449870 [Ochromonadaceae sp. CCMP2298]
MERRAVLLLYKEILFSAQRFPSIKRLKLVEEIRLGFRANRDLKDQEEVKKHLSVAIDGLSKLSMYGGLDRRNTNWSVSMESQPMPRKSG